MLYVFTGYDVCSSWSSLFRFVSCMAFQLWFSCFPVTTKQCSAMPPVPRGTSSMRTLTTKWRWWMPVEWCISSASWANPMRSFERPSQVSAFRLVWTLPMSSTMHRYSPGHYSITLSSWSQSFSFCVSLVWRSQLIRHQNKILSWLQVSCGTCPPETTWRRSCPKKLYQSWQIKCWFLCVAAFHSARLRKISSSTQLAASGESTHCVLPSIGFYVHKHFNVQWVKQCHHTKRLLADEYR